MTSAFILKGAGLEHGTFLCFSSLFLPLKKRNSLKQRTRMKNEIPENGFVSPPRPDTVSAPSDGNLPRSKFEEKKSNQITNSVNSSLKQENQ